MTTEFIHLARVCIELQLIPFYHVHPGDADLDPGSTIALLMTKHKLPMSTLRLPVAATARPSNTSRLLPPISLRRIGELDVSVHGRDSAAFTFDANDSGTAGARGRTRAGERAGRARASGEAKFRVRCVGLNRANE